MVTQQREQDEGPLQEFVAELHEQAPPLQRVPGTAVFLNRGKETAPLAMRATVEHYKVLHAHVVVLSLETLPVPRVPADERLMRLETAEIECPIEVDTASYFVSTIELQRGTAPTMHQWRKRRFVATSAINADAAELQSAA